MCLIILFYSVDGMIYFHDSGMHVFFFKCLVMYLFYACNLPNDSWNIFGIYLSIWLPTDLGPRKKLQMLGISLKRHEHRNQASTLKGGEQLKDSLVRTSCYVQSVVRYHISSVVCILHNLHTVNIRQYRCTVCKDIYIYTCTFCSCAYSFFLKKTCKTICRFWVLYREHWLQVPRRNQDVLSESET